MSNATMLDFLTKCQHLQREARHCEVTITYSLFQQGIIVSIDEIGTTRFWRFYFDASETDKEQEKTYKELHHIYSKLEEHEQHNPQLP